MTAQTLDQSVADALRTVAVNGAFHASRALSKWLKRGVSLTSTGFNEVAFSDAYSVIGDPESVIAAIHLPLSGDVSGHMLLAFPETVALALADVIMQQPIGTSIVLDEIEQSALEETGNIVCSAYANSLAKCMDLRVEPTAPGFACDMACSVIGSLLTDFAASSDSFFVTRTDFQMGDQKLDWRLMLLPSAASLQLMQTQCGGGRVRFNSLRSLAVNGAFDASRAVSKWLKRGVRLASPDIERLPIADVCDLFDENEPIAALHVPLGLEAHGHALLAISENNARELVDLVCDQPKGTCTKLDEMERSCLQETGNIIVSSFVNSWAGWLNTPMEIQAPQFIYDLPGAVMDSLLSEQALLSDDVLLARTKFVVADRTVDWLMFVLPSPSTLRLLDAFAGTEYEEMGA